MVDPKLRKAFGENPVVTIYDQIDGRKDLYMDDLNNRLRAQAMKRARAIYPDQTLKWRELASELRTHGTIERKDGKNIFTLVMTDMNEKVWARYQVEVLDA